MIFALSMALTYLLMKAGARFNLLDFPNARSSHLHPRPRGGGAAFTLAFFIGVCFLWELEALKTKWIIPLAVGGLPVAFIGFLDDMKSRSAFLRLAVHFSAAILAYGYLTDWFNTVVDISFLPGTGGDFWEIGFAIFYVAWMVNLYNFMDGIDGLAATQAVVVAALSAGLCAWQGNWSLFSLYAALGATVFGFLWFNWAPAKIFMGDCGAYFLGFAFACLALMSKIYSNQSLIAHMILLGVFISDATYTLSLRMLQKKKLYQAHKDHGFQHFVSKGRTHAQVAVIWNGITVFWLGPMAVLSVIYTDWSFAILILSYLPLLAFMIYLQAGIEWCVKDFTGSVADGEQILPEPISISSHSAYQSKVRELEL